MLQNDSAQKSHRTAQAVVPGALEVVPEQGLQEYDEIAPASWTETRNHLGSHPKASIIVVSYNSKRHLQACLRSLAPYSGGEYEVIVVDNASSDDSADMVQAAFPAVRLIRSPVNGGFGGANNLGARLAHGEYLAFLNPDTVVEAGWLEHLIEVLEAHPEAGMATPQILLLRDRQQVNTCGNDTHFTGLTLCRGAGTGRMDGGEPTEVSAVSGAAFVMRKRQFEALGGFDEAFFMYMEDTDLSWRTWLAGYSSLYVPSSVVYHDYSLRFGPNKTYYQERNRYLMLLKHLHWGTLLAFLPALLLAEIVTWGFTLTRDRKNLKNKFRAYAWLMGHWNDAMQRRRQTQSLRRVRDRDLIRRWTHRLAFEQTGTGRIAQLSHVVFDPAFLLLHRMALALVRW